MYFLLGKVSAWEFAIINW